MTQLQTTLRQLRLSGLMQTLDCACRKPRPAASAMASSSNSSFRTNSTSATSGCWPGAPKPPTFAPQTLEDFDWHFNPPSTANRSLSWPRAITCAKARTFYLLVRRESARRIWPRPWLRSHQTGQGGPLSVHLRSRARLHERRSLQTTGQDSAPLLKPDLVIIDDMGLKALPKQSGEYLLEVVMRRYENRSTIMTSNRPLEDWGNCSPTCRLPEPSSIASCTTPPPLPLPGAAIGSKTPATGPGKQKDQEIQ